MNAPITIAPATMGLALTQSDKLDRSKPDDAGVVVGTTPVDVGDAEIKLDCRPVADTLGTAELAMGDIAELGVVELLTDPPDTRRAAGVPGASTG